METYDDSLRWLNSFINLEKKRSDQFRPEMMNLDRPRRLLARLGDPHKAYPSIHIAGTKGKGSTAALCAAALRSAGYRVGLYTSPHLLDIRERFRVLDAGDEAGAISREAFVELVGVLRPAVAADPALTWFEIFTALAFLHFARCGVDVAVVEVGLGGRLDATNVITPLVSVITRLSLDHTALLGDTLEAIAAEKGGIIKPGVPLVSAPQPPEGAAVLARMAVERGSPLTVVGDAWRFSAALTPGRRPVQRVTVDQAPAGSLLPLHQSIPLALLGAHQAENGVVAAAALTIAAPHLPRLTPAALLDGFAGLRWPGRLQTLNADRADEPLLVVDSAHNEESAQRLLATLGGAFVPRRLWLIFGAGLDKDYRGMLGVLLPGVTGCVLTRAAHPRAAGVDLLRRTALELGFPPPATAPDVTAALEQLWGAAGQDDVICVTGSIFLVAEVLGGRPRRS